MTQPNALHDAKPDQVANLGATSAENPKGDGKDSNAASNDEQHDARRGRATEDSQPDADAAGEQKR